MRSRMARRLALVGAVLTLALVASPVSARSKKKSVQDWMPDSFPNPYTDVKLCGRGGVKSWICDPDQIMSKKGADILEGIIKLIAAGEPPYGSMTCGSAGRVGYELGFALMRKMVLAPGQDSGVAAEQFAQALHSKWGVGRAECQNGVLVFLAVDDRRLYMSTGQGTRDHLTDDQLDVIIARARGKLRESDYDAALQGVAVDIGIALSGQTIEPDSSHKEEEWDWFGTLVVIGFFGFFGFVVWHNIRRSAGERRRYRDCKALLDRLKRDQGSLQSGAYEVTSCPICLEDFTPDNGSTADNDTSEHSGGAKGGGDKTSGDTGKQASASEISKLGASTGSSKGDSSKAADPATPTSPAAAAAASETAPLLAGTAAAATGAAAAIGAAAAAGAAAVAARRPLVVQCGHVFCEPCLERWVEQQRKFSCPICRRDMDTGDAPPPAPPPSTGAAYGGGGVNGDRGTNAGDGAGPSTSRCAEQLNQWEQEFPEAVLMPEVGAAAASSTPRLRLDTQGWERTRSGQWRYRGANGYSTRDWQRVTRGTLTEEQIIQLQRDELLFRIMALRRRYPEFVTTDMARTWAQDVSAGRQLSAQAVRDFMLRDPVVRDQLQRSGASGASSSWGGGGGGGRSSGGRGGSW